METEQNLSKFNSRLQKLRAVTGKSQAEIAALLDVSRTMLHYYATGQHTPKASVVFRLEQAEREAGVRVPRAGGSASGGEPVPAGDHPLPEEPGQTAGRGTRTEAELIRHLRWLDETRARQQQATQAAQRHLDEIDGWIVETETELSQVRGEAGNARFALPREKFLSSAMSGSSGLGTAQGHPAARKEKRAYLRDIDTVSLPIFGALPAGFPQTREGVMAQRPVRKERVRRGRFPEGAFGLEVRGDSMNAAKPDPILDRDIVVLLSPEQREPKHDDIVAALIDGETCLKRLKARKKGRAFLKSESLNPAHGEIHPTHDLVIQGVVVGKL